MSNDKEKISAYLDDGLRTDELDAVESIESGSDLGAASRYHMMGEAMRGHVSDAAMVDVSVQVREALRNEESLKNIQATERSARQGVKQPASSLFDFSAWFRPLGGLAVAASVAVVVVVAVTEVESPTGNDNLVAGTDASSVSVPVVSIPEVDVSAPVTVAVEETQPRNQPAVNLDAYLAEHAEFAAQDTLQGRMPYARAVSHESE